MSGGKKLPKLRELILEGNPVRDRDIAKNKDDLAYRRYNLISIVMRLGISKLRASVKVVTSFCLIA